ncbi:exosortase Y-associated Wzy-like protein [Desertivirga xinjiangensis]|uniref:exosortase Y-associated Wzy-like protein n=1 Tax=Desertivirga xinjiangensis TaxID=539206 RepID=UPI0021095A62|nr:hypothetical protein [Pedobacter xinjiangensis]
MVRVNDSKAGAIVPLFIPWLLATLTQLDPVVSYWIAWSGSFFIFFWTLIFPSRFISNDLPIHQQIMRPLFLTQIIFAGFMCCTSVFFFLDHMGYIYLEKTYPQPFIATEETSVIAKCQRMSVLGHAALATGMITLIERVTPLKKYRLNNNLKQDHFLVGLSFSAYILGFLVRYLPGLYQFSIGLVNTGVICGALIMVKGIVQKKTDLLLIGGSLFVVNMISASLTGYKEPIIVNFLIVGCLIYPYYKKATIFIGLPLIYFLFYILPTYANIIRSQSWNGQASAEEARGQALETLFNEDNGEVDLDETNWAFLTRRLSEIEMFAKFVETTPKDIDYYGFEIAEQTLISLVPRFLWPGKPITETMAMERVYNAGVVSRLSKVSAKTRPIVDAYLSGGTVGVLISMFLYGFICQALCNKAESLYGGYQLGGIILYNGCFQPAWRGNNFEFIANSVFWSFILMLLIFQLLKLYKILIPIKDGDHLSNQQIM